MCTLLHSWGRLRAPPGALLDTPTQKHPRNGLPQPLPSWGPAAQLQPVGFQRSHLGCPFLVPSGLKRAGLSEEGHCPLGLRHPKMAVNMSPAPREAN